jgi:hypothetical protein
MPGYNPPAAATTTAAVEPLRGNVELYIPVGTSSNSITVIGNSLAITGSQGSVNLTSTSYRSSTARTTLLSLTTAGSIGGVRANNSTRWRGNAAGLGGFELTFRFGSTLLAGHQCHLGLISLATQLTADPSTLASGIALATDAADTNFQWLARDGAAFTKVDTGIARTDARLLRMRLYAAPNAASVLAELRDDQTGTLLNTSTLTTNLPPNTTFLGFSAQTRNGATTTGAAIDFVRADCVGQPLT